jgi:hypothetical protein
VLSGIAKMASASMGMKDSFSASRFEEAVEVFINSATIIGGSAFLQTRGLNI